MKTVEKKSAGYPKTRRLNIATQKSFFQLFWAGIWGLGDFCLHFLSPNLLIPAKTFLELYIPERAG